MRTAMQTKPKKGKERKVRSSLEPRGRDKQNSRSQNQRLNYQLMQHPLGKPMTKEEADIVRDVEDEFKRRGRFRRIFPSTEYSYYK